MEVVAALLGVGALLLVLAVVAGLFLSRQRTLSHRVASFTCLLRESEPAPWTPGIAQYGSGRLMWWRTLSLSPRPARTWSRSELTLVERVPLDEQDEAGRPLLLVHCRHRGHAFSLMMSAPACAGLVSWLESGPRSMRRVI